MWSHRLLKVGGSYLLCLGYRGLRERRGLSTAPPASLNILVVSYCLEPSHFLCLKVCLEPLFLALVLSKHWVGTCTFSVVGIFLQPRGCLCREQPTVG